MLAAPCLALGLLALLGCAAPAGDERAGAGGAAGSVDPGGGLGGGGVGGAEGRGGAGAGGAGGGAPACDAPTIVAVMQLGEDRVAAEVPDGGTVDLVGAVQGGHVLFVGARVAGLCADRADLHAVLRSPADGSVVAEDLRQGVPMLEGAGGTREPDWAGRQVAMVPACPSLRGARIAGEAFDLELTVTDPAGPAASARVRARLSCSQTDAYWSAFCSCVCEAGYTPDKCG